MGDGIADLLTDAFTDPTGVIAEVGERLSTATPSERCQLLRALGNACRELRRTSEATMHHEAALEVADEIGDATLIGLAAMSLSSTLTYDGAFDRALSLIDRSVELLDGDDRLVAMTQRAAILQRAGRHHDALEAFDAAFAAVDGIRDPSLEWDLWTNRGVLHGWLGHIEAGEADTRRALDMFTRSGWHKRAADAQHNLAWLAGRRGDIVEALRYFDLAQATYERAGVPPFAIFPDRCETLLAAGLAREALATAERSATNLEVTGDHADRAEALLLVARSAVLAGRPERASAAAQEASSLFARQHRAGWSSAADALTIESRFVSGRAVQADLGEALAISEHAAATGLPEVGVDARLLAADIAAVLGDWDACEAAIEPFEEVP
jgi:tetratricopeptide (TPR) repeat protein